MITPSSVIDDGGSFTVGGQSFRNAAAPPMAALTLVPAIQVSSDVFFYPLGFDMRDTAGSAGRTSWRCTCRPGSTSPAPKSACCRPNSGATSSPPKGWPKNGPGRPATTSSWRPARATSTSTRCNGDRLRDAGQRRHRGHPHVGLEVTDAAGRVLKEFAPKLRRHVKFKQESRDVILEGLHLAAQAPGGTSYAVFGGFPTPVAGKTGTAQRVGHEDQSWYIVLAPYPNPRIVTAVTIEEGGFGAESAAPAALQILEAYFGKHSSGGAKYKTNLNQVHKIFYVLHLATMINCTILSLLASGTRRR